MGVGYLKDDLENEALDRFMMAFANKVLELAHRPGGIALTHMGMGTASGLSAKLKLDNLIALKPKRRWNGHRSRAGA